MGPVPASAGEPARAVEGRYRDIVLATDEAGSIHAAARNKAGIWYLTNRFGSWQRTQVSVRPAWSIDLLPSIAIDSSGRVHIAFERDTCLKCVPSIDRRIFYTTDSGSPTGAFSVPIQIASGDSPSIATYGMVPLVAYAHCPCNPTARTNPVYLAWHSDDAWQPPLQIASRGQAPSLRVGPTGTTHTAYSYNGNLWVARWRFPGSVQDVLRVPYGRVGAGNVSLALDSLGQPHLAWTVAKKPAQGGGTYYAVKTAEWSGGRVTQHRYAVDVAVAGASPHLVVLPKGVGVHHFRRLGGVLTGTTLSSTALIDSAAIAVKPNGTVVIAYTAFKYVPTGIYVVERTQ
jgi:hypothetical protein